jgi:cytochrome c oxidase assembly protein subunit 11
MDMAVSFFVSPDMVDDKDASHIGLITLSYTFFLVEKPRVSTAGDGTAGPGKGS